MIMVLDTLGHMTKASAFEPEFVSGLKSIFEERIAFNKTLGLQITEIAGDGVGATIASSPARSALGSTRWAVSR
jgi:hypothetical protein